MPLDHLVLSAPKPQFEQVVAFYLAALGPLGYTKRHEYPGIAVGLGDNDDRADFWIGAKENSTTTPYHLAFTAKDRQSVVDFYHAAIGAGAKGNGEPGLRPHYGPTYYGGFVLDPLGNNLEAVCRAEE